MSAGAATNSKPIFASRTAFEALVVDPGEDVQEDTDEESSSASVLAESLGPVKLSKSQIKKAAKTARTERRKQLKTANKTGTTTTTDSSPRDTPAPEEPPLPIPMAEPDITSIVQHTPKPATTTKVDHEMVEADSPQQHAFLNGGTSEKLYNVSVIPESHSDPPEKTVEKVAIDHHNGDAERALKLGDGGVETERTKKRQNMLTRTLWTFIMIGGFIGLLLMGHVYMIILVMLCQTLVYREVTALFSLRNTAPESSDVETKGKKDPWSKTLNWYFFAVTNYFLYGESIIYYFKHVVFADAQLLPFATNHRIISFTLYTIGFMGFVMSLKRGYLKQQFGLFCWVHMSLLLIVVSSHFIVNNILEGLIWFWVPASLVICNDVFAYIWGITLGRTPLIKLSPKKTVEGFVGAFFSTVIFGIIWGSYFMRFDYMICPVHDLGVDAWSSGHCTPNPIFIWREWQIWAPLRVFISPILGNAVTTIPYVPYQFHLLCMSVFASLVAPFGGFFASGFKRAFNIKDFGHSIPGHGGMTDRMDCQFLMGVFTYVYYSSLIREHHVTVGSILQMIVSGLTMEEQLELMKDLRRYLQGQGIMTA